MTQDTDPSLPPETLSSPALPLDPTLQHTGKYVSLRPLQLSDANHLYTLLGGPGNAHIYTYMPSEPFLSLPAFTAHMNHLVSDPSIFAYSIFPNSPSSHSGSLGLIVLEPVPQHHRCEIGVIYSSALQRSTYGTEAIYLLLQYAFSQQYVRVEWKCDTRNEASMKAARRIGFVYEGTLRKHQAFRGRRDTIWFSVLDDEWGMVGKALEEWLREENFEGGVQRRRLESFRS